MRRFEFQDERSHKFWAIAVEGAELLTQWGRMGTTGQQKTKAFADGAAAQKEADKLIRQKTKKGYAEVSSGSEPAGQAQTATTDTAPKAKAPAAQSAPVSAGSGSDPAKPMENLVHRLNTTLLRDVRYKNFAPSAAIKNKWLGRRPVSDKAIKKAEKTLAVTLPPSYVHFLKVANGFGYLSDMEMISELNFVYHVTGDRFPHHRFSYQRFIAENEGYGFIADCYQLGLYLLMNPSVVTAEGEWEVIEFNFRPSLTRQLSAEFKAEVKRFPSFEHWLRAKVEELESRFPSDDPLDSLIAQFRAGKDQCGMLSALGYMKDPRSQDFLLEVFHDESHGPRVRGFASDALALLKYPVFDLITPETLGAGICFVSAVVDSRKRKTPQRIIDILTHPDPVVQKAAVQILAYFKDKTGLFEAIAQAFDASDSDEVRIEAARSLFGLGTHADDPAQEAFFVDRLNEDFSEPLRVAFEDAYQRYAHHLSNRRNALRFAKYAPKKGFLSPIPTPELVNETATVGLWSIETWRTRLDASAEDLGWALRKSASEKNVAAVEKRLGLTLPPSFRRFLLATNGLAVEDGDTEFVEELFGTSDIQWLAEQHQDEVIDAWCGDEPQDPISDEEYLDAADTVVMRNEYLQTAVLISACGSGACLLNPKVVTKDGEWEAWFLASWLPGAERHPSFQDLLAERLDE